MGPLAIVDLETTGLSAERGAEILEFGAVLVDRDTERVTTLHSLVRPRGRIPLAVRRLTGLSDADVASSPPIEELASPIASALAGRTLIAHNADFEREFLGGVLRAARTRVRPGWMRPGHPARVADRRARRVPLDSSR